jgi:hypothetical protein
MLISASFLAIKSERNLLYGNIKKSFQVEFMQAKIQYTNYLRRNSSSVSEEVVDLDQKNQEPKLEEQTKQTKKHKKRKLVYE